MTILAILDEHRLPRYWAETTKTVDGVDWYKVSPGDRRPFDSLDETIGYVLSRSSMPQRRWRITDELGNIVWGPFTFKAAHDKAAS